MYEAIILIVSVFFFFQSQVMLNHLVQISTKFTHYLFGNMGNIFGGMLFLLKGALRLLVDFLKIVTNRKKLPSSKQHWLKIKL